MKVLAVVYVVVTVAAPMSWDPMKGIELKK